MYLLEELVAVLVEVLLAFFVVGIVGVVVVVEYRNV